MIRSFDRKKTDLRPLTIETDIYDYAEGSCIISYGRTKVLCTATLEDRAPGHLKGTGSGWVTAEYAMMPRSSTERIRRDRNKVGGRTYEIQRLIGRTLRSVTNLKGWGERSIIIDCDVMQADGGTRTASITGAFIVLGQCFKKMAKMGLIDLSLNDIPFPLKSYMSAVSVGIVKGEVVTDLDYSEDSTAETDMNLVMTSDSGIVEIQGTAEQNPFSEDEFAQMLSHGRSACDLLCKKQAEVLGSLSWK